MLKQIALTLAFAFVAFGQQNTLVQTSLSAALPGGQSTCQDTLVVASATGISTNPPTVLYIDREAMPVVSYVGTTIRVRRGALGTSCVGHASSAMVLLGRPDWFYSYEKTGTCTSTTEYVTPQVNISTGYQTSCSSVTGTYVPHWNHPGARQPNTAVASAAGLITPSGPLFHITGTSAITGFNTATGAMVGFAGGDFCAVADAIWTWTAASNIFVAGTTTAAGRRHCFVYDAVAAKFYPDKVI